MSSINSQSESSQLVILFVRPKPTFEMILQTPEPTEDHNNAKASQFSRYIETSSALQDVAENLIVMRKQEGTIYKRRDIYSMKTQLSDCMIDGSWRQKIVEWMYSVVDNCQLRRDSVAVAACYLDLSLENGLIDCRRQFQLVALTALYLAVKVYDSKSFKLNSMVKLSRGLFTGSDVIEMERKMLIAMKWRVHPPTTVCFIREYLQLLPSSLPSLTRYLIVEVTRFLSEISVFLTSFVKYSPSMIGVASALIALERVDEVILPLWNRRKIFDQISNIYGSEYNPQEILEAYEDLQHQLQGNRGFLKLLEKIDLPGKVAYEQ